MAKMRDLGMEANFCIRRDLGDESFKKNQFVIALLITPDEIEREDYVALEEFENYILEHGQRTAGANQGDRILYLRQDSVHRIQKERCIIKNRVVLLLNKPNPSYIHGEARLLDPRGEILRRIGALNNDIDRNEIDYLELMRREQQPNQQYILAMFSFFMPCTLHSHQCAELIGEFANTQSFFSKIIVSYHAKYTHDTTNDPNLAHRHMRENGVRIVSKKEVAMIIDEETKSWYTDDLEDTEFYTE